jgi:hypothetical protein
MLHVCTYWQSAFLPNLAATQGDQIGRIFAFWAIVFSGQFFENKRSSPKLWATIFRSKNYVLILPNNGLGDIFGRCFHKLIWSPCRHSQDTSLFPTPFPPPPRVAAAAEVAAVAAAASSCWGGSRVTR